MKGIALVSLLAASALAQNMNALPTCSKFCLESMIGKAEQLDCNVGDWSCLCSTSDFWYGLRDCTTEACDGFGLAAANEAVAGMCPSGSVVGPSSSPDSLGTSSLAAPSKGASSAPSTGSKSSTGASPYGAAYPTNTPASSINRKINAAVSASSVPHKSSAIVATAKPSSAVSAGTAATAFDVSMTADYSSASDLSDDIINPKSTKSTSSSRGSNTASKTSAVYDLQATSNQKSNDATRPSDISTGVIAALCLLSLLAM